MTPINLQPPKIEPVPTGMPRPLWSVMIPTFNCANYLRQTLESVLAQDPGPEKMQIEVVDDCSTKDDPEAVVREIGNGRVAFYRKPQNAGAIANFNTCIERSRGQLVHILHGDDLVLPGFYQKLESLAQAYPEAGFIASRCFFIDEEGVILGVTGRLQKLEAGGRAAELFYYENHIQCPGAVVRRSFYERHGGFLPGLVHSADYEMWSRAVGLEGGVTTPEILACYRTFAANDSGRLKRTAENLRDLARVRRLFAARYPDFDREKGMQDIIGWAFYQANFFAGKGDHEAAKANWAYWRQITPFKLRLRHHLGRLARKII